MGRSVSEQGTIRSNIGLHAHSPLTVGRSAGLSFGPTVIFQTNKAIAPQLLNHGRDYFKKVLSPNSFNDPRRMFRTFRDIFVKG